MISLSKLIRIKVWLLLLLLNAPATAFSNNLTLGLIGEEPTEDMRKILPLAQYLGKQLEKEGITQGKVLIARSMNEMSFLLREGKVDLNFESYGRTLALNRLSGSKPLLRRWKKGVAEYFGVIFARADNGIARLEDLLGKTIALEEEFSTVGHLLPKFLLAERGLKVVPTERPPADAVGYTFAYWDENTIHWVVKGRVSAGAMDSQNFAEIGEKESSALRIIAKTPSVPRHVVSTRPGLNPALLGKLKLLLTQMDKSDDGKKALQQFDRTTKFDELTEQNAALTQRMNKLVEGELKLH